MNQPVSIKGVKSGLVLKLDKKKEFSELIPLMQEKFSTSAAFFGKSKMVLSIEGRAVSDEETQSILKIIEDDTELEIIAVVTENAAAEKKLRENAGDILKLHEEIDELSHKNSEIEKMLAEFQSALNGNTAEIHIGTLRSGTTLDVAGSLILLGDVKPGATVTAGGSIFILGALKGNADAGAYGDSTAFVMALDMDPLQVRISDAMAISQDKEIIKHAKKFLRPKEGAIPEAALISGGHIVIKDFNSEFIKECRFLKEKTDGGNIDG